MSCRFGTFLFNSFAERRSSHTFEKVLIICYGFSQKKINLLDNFFVDVSLKFTTTISVLESSVSGILCDCYVSMILMHCSRFHLLNWDGSNQTAMRNVSYFGRCSFSSVFVILLFFRVFIWGGSGDEVRMQEWRWFLSKVNILQYLLAGKPASC